MKRLFLFVVLGAFLVCGFTSSQAGQVVFEWDANSEEDLAGYRLYQSRTSGQYTYETGSVVGIATAGTQTLTLTIREDGKFFWVLTAYDTAGNESGPSNEVSTTINFKPPAPPAGCTLRVLR